MAMFGDPENFIVMSDREKYLYDLQGFLVVRNFLSQEEVENLNNAINANLDKASQHDPGGTLDGTPLAGPNAQYIHYNGMPNLLKNNLLLINYLEIISWIKLISCCLESHSIY